VWYLWCRLAASRNLPCGACRKKAERGFDDRPDVTTAFAVSVALMAAFAATAHAQDVPGIEICTVEKTMERRTSCLQSNVDFLQKTITKLTLDHQQKIDSANRQIEGLKGAVGGPAEDRE